MFITVNAANDLAGAKKYTMGTKATGKFYEDDEPVVYKFSISNSGKIDISLFADVPYIYAKLYDADGQDIWYTTIYDNDTTEEIRYKEDMYLCAGTYYLTMENNNSNGEFELEITETSVYETFQEKQNGSNNSTKTANQISYGKDYIGCLAKNDDTDIYKFTLSESGNMKFDVFSNINYIHVELFDENGERVWYSSLHDNDTTKEIKFQEDLHLIKGTYYFSFKGSSNTGEYRFRFDFTSAYESFSENLSVNNNQTSSANLIKINNQYNGQIALNDDVDIYRIDINKPNPTLNINGKNNYLYVQLFDQNGERVWYSSVYDNDTIKEIRFSEKVNSSTGLHYLSISGSTNVGNYSFNLTDGGKIIMAPKPNTVISVIVNDKKVNFDQQPILENGRTLVPLRAIFEALGADVKWDDPTKTVTATKGGIKISLQIGSTNLYVNGNVKILDVPAKLINSRTLVPVRAISEAFGCKVDWIDATQTVIITD